MGMRIGAGGVRKRYVMGGYSLGMSMEWVEVVKVARQRPPMHES
jgi:hypothetical protein